MGKTGKWIKQFLIGKKDKEKNCNIGTKNEVDETLGLNGPPTTPITVQSTPPAKDKKRWSFRRSSTTTPPGHQQPQQVEGEHKKHALGLNVSSDAAGVVVKAAADAAMDLTPAASNRVNAIDQSAATKIQSFYRGYLSRKALNALRGLVKLQALVRGHLVRKQAAATLRCMQALITVQSRARAQRLHMVEESRSYNNQKQFNHRKSAHEFRRESYQDLERGTEENVKIVEMDPGDAKPNIRSRSSYSSYGNGQMYPFEHLTSTYKTSSKHDQQQQIPPPSPSAINELSPRTNSGHFEDYSFNAAQSSPQYYPKIPTNYPTSEHAESLYSEYPQMYPSYMANTQSSKAKVRSHSAPKSRPESYERQNSGRRRPSIEGRNVPRGVKMQRSSSHVATVAQNYQYPWSIKLDKSAVSLKDSECGSSSTVLTNANYCKSSLVGFQVHGHRY
ncbi:hypothetical protein LIER_29238 [Lithospermum erythrorhizon]|uniref:DUF4005 domain-containing protein n=1 Tax=Lithospermum erythrorhizon TaxID=34254 RepID=A0AAV3RKA7_LITER